MDGFQSLRCLWRRLDKKVQSIMLKLGMFGYVWVYMGMYGYVWVYMGSAYLNIIIRCGIQYQIQKY